MRFFFAKLLLHFFALLPLPVNHALGHMIGRLLYWLPNKTKRITLINLHLCLPELTPKEMQQLTKRSLIEMGKSLTELGPIWIWKPERLLKKVRGIENEQALHDIQAKDVGKIFLTPHHACWEITSLWYAPRYGVTCLYRPPRMSEIENWLVRARERSGARLVPTNANGVKALYATLINKQTVGILPDQDPGQGAGLFVPFFGQTANTVKLIPRLIQKTGARVILLYAERLPRGKGYTLHYLQPDEAIYSSDPIESATAMNQLVERAVRECPSQYQWSYKRFKTRADDSPSPYQ